MRKLLHPTLWTEDIEKRWVALLNGCGQTTCTGAKSFWHRMRRHRNGILMEGVLYCRPECMQSSLAAHLTRLQEQPASPPPSNRIPLGLLMVARGKLSYNEVLAALEAQRRAGYGKIGEWIEKLGFASEGDVTAALAIQWGCPIASSLKTEAIGPPHQVPLALLEAFHMWPQQYASSTNTLCLAFGERVDHGVLYAIEKMLDCRTLPCVAGRKAIAQQLERRRAEPRPNEIIRFGPMQDPSEMARIAGSYIAKLGAEEVRLHRLGPYIWVRMRTRPVPVDVLFRLRSAQRYNHVPFRLMIPPPLERVENYWDSGAAE